MNIAILYGSQTGTAQDVAEQIWRESKARNCNGPVSPLDDFALENYMDKELIVFVIATTGDGEAPDNMRQTWKMLLRRSLAANTFQGLRFAVLGLGDSSYPKFNFAAKKLSKRLLQLGAQEFIPTGLCDDQHDYGLSAVSLTWTAQLWEKLGPITPLNEKVQSKNVFRWNVNVLTDRTKQLADEVQLNWPYKLPHQQFLLKDNERVTATDHFQDVRLLKFEFPANCTWNPGDVLQVRPCNSDKKVSEFFELVAEHKLNFDAETRVHLTSAFDDMEVPLVYAKPVTVGQLVKYVWDLNFKPRQRAFELLSIGCEDELEKEKLEEFASYDGIEDLINYINRPRRSVLEVLQDFRHATSRLTLPILFELFPIIQARSFSIASIPATGTLDLLVAVVEYKTKLSNPRLGLCSNWLKEMSPGTSVLGAIKAGTMKLPKTLRTPIIMVGPGTGIAPFRSIIQSVEMNSQLSNESVGKLVVYFGCRNADKDFYFKDEFAQWQADRLIELSVAFSRDQPDKVYVQHLIAKNKEVLRQLIEFDEAVILIAGSSNSMPKAVKEAFVDVMNGNADYIERMVQNKRYQEETWS